MTVDAGDVIRVASRMSYGAGGQDLINVTHHELTTPGSLPDADVLTDMGLLMESYYFTIDSLMNDTITFVDYTVTNVTKDVVLGTDNWPTLTVGGSIVDALPPQNAALVLARTSTPRKQGRTYLPGFAEDNTSGSLWIAGTLAALANFAGLMLVSITVGSGTYVYRVFTRPDDGPPIILAKADPPTTVAVIPFVRTQRRRSSFFGT